MDPLTIFVGSIVGALIVDALQQPGDFTDYYRRDPEIFQGWMAMHGSNVVWWVEEGNAVWIKAKYLRPIAGNIFDSEKLGAVAREVRDSETPVAFYASYGQISQIGLDDIAESRQYADYDVGDPLTTGDDELDDYLANPDPDPEETADLQDELAQAVAEGWGDLGEWTASVRDGNHRSFGSVLGGEEHIAVRIYDNDAQGLRDRLDRGELKPKYRALLHKIITDTGTLTDWMKRYPHELGEPWEGTDLLIAVDPYGLDLTDEAFVELGVLFETAGVARHFSRHAVAVARDATGAIVGAVTGSDELTVAVAPSHQQEGIGSELIRRLVAAGGGGFMVAGTDAGAAFLHRLPDYLGGFPEELDVPMWEALQIEEDR